MRRPADKGGRTVAETELQYHPQRSRAPDHAVRWCCVAHVTWCSDTLAMIGMCFAAYVGSSSESVRPLRPRVGLRTILVAMASPPTVAMMAAQATNITCRGGDPSDDHSSTILGNSWLIAPHLLSACGSQSYELRRSDSITFVSL